jgi:hypothetical protein
LSQEITPEQAQRLLARMKPIDPEAYLSPGQTGIFGNFPSQLVLPKFGHNFPLEHEESDVAIVAWADALRAEGIIPPATVGDIPYILLPFTATASELYKRQTEAARNWGTNALLAEAGPFWIIWRKTGAELNGVGAPAGLTINSLVDLVTEINTANGWRENKGEILTPEHPMAQIAATSTAAGAIAEIVEGIRKGADRIQTKLATGHLARTANTFDSEGLKDAADGWLDGVGELGSPVRGSKTEAVARTRLFDTESVELSDAIVNGDLANMAEELADGVIRPIDFVGDWNDTHPDQQIDLQAAILAKLEVNRQRGYRHGGKRA